MITNLWMELFQALVHTNTLIHTDPLPLSMIIMILPRSAGGGSPCPRGAGEPVGQDEGGAPVPAPAPPAGGGLVPQGGRRHLRGGGEPPLHAAAAQQLRPRLLRLQVQAVREAGLHVGRRGLRAVPGGAAAARHAGAGRPVRGHLQDGRRRGGGRGDGQVHGGAGGDGRGLQVGGRGQYTQTLEI